MILRLLSLRMSLIKRERKLLKIQQSLKLFKRRNLFQLRFISTNLKKHKSLFQKLFHRVALKNSQKVDSIMAKPFYKMVIGSNMVKELKCDEAKTNTQDLGKKV